MAVPGLFLPLILLQSAAGAPADAEAPPPAPAAESGGQPATGSTSDDQAPPPDVDSGMINGRRKPGFVPPLPDKVAQDNPGAVRAPPPEAFPTDQIPIPDRWRLIQSLGVVKEHWWDPYHQNTYKGDRPINRAKVPWLPIHGDDWFVNVNLISDTVIEPRTFPIPVGVQTTNRPQSLNVFGKDGSLVLSQTFLAGASLIKGSTAFKPPEVEYRLTLAFNINYARVPETRVLYVDPAKGTHRTDDFVGIQEAFVERHLRNVSDRYDFDAVRVGIQPFQADFRGFLFNDDQLGIRFFGNRDDNRVQYNLAAFWRLEKDTNSGLNNVTERPRNDFVFLANIYRQDFLLPGLTSQVTVAYNRNREASRIKIDDNGFPVRPSLLGDVRPHNYDVVYLGYNADGRIGRFNLTASAYYALGHDSNNFLTSHPARIRAWFAAAELSFDRDWMRFRLSGLYASGDGNPYDDKEGGFDAIFENPVFAGADTSYWIRQSIPFAGGGRAVTLSGRNGILNDLRSSKEQGQSNFNNPGTVLVGAGADLDLTPQWRLSANANHLWFANTATLQALRNEGSIPRDIGWDLSVAAVWRPKASQNIVVRLSGAMLAGGSGMHDLFTNEGRRSNYFSLLANVVLSY